MQEITIVNNIAGARNTTYTFGEVAAYPAKEDQEMALLAMSHTKIEHALYELMLTETRKSVKRAGSFSVRYLMIQSTIHNYSAVRSARAGLLEKLSIERQKAVGNKQDSSVIYVVYSPAEIFARREAAGILSGPKEIADDKFNGYPSALIIERLVEQHNLSRREAQVALICAEGLTNAEIGEKLFIKEETVKFHLRNTFIKFGVKRRTELMAHLFRQNAVN